MTKRIYCLSPSERRKECTDHAWHYTGRIPNTGPIACHWCGTRKLDQSTLSQTSLLGCVIGASGDTYVVKLTPSEHIVVITGPGNKMERQEWRYTFEQVKECHESLLFEKVGDLLRAKGLMA